MSAYRPYGGEVRRLLQEFGLQAHKGLGQNFLVDEGIAKRIAEAASGGVQGQTCLEIGSGLGALTLALAVQFQEVVTVEVDRGLAALLRQKWADVQNGATVRLIEGDALRLPLQELFPEEGPDVVCGNLPYSITGPLTARLLELFRQASRFVFMLQSEVVDRMLAAPGTPEYGAFTVLVQAYAQPKRLMQVGKESFYPRPKVASSVVVLERHMTSPWKGSADASDIVRIARIAFQQRRKTLVNALSPLIAHDRQRTRQWLEKANIDPAQRPEQIDLHAYARLAEMFPEMLEIGKND